MFTGIIQAVGKIQQIESSGDDKRIVVNTAELEMSDVHAGDSIAINGVCLTVIDILDDGFSADVSRETLAVTTLSSLHEGAGVNLEKALLPTVRLGGHLVSGHVDGVGSVIDMHDDGRSVRMRVTVPEALEKYVAKKGSICIDGVSLTVNEISSGEVSINIIPHTLQNTIISGYQRGARVNVEVDIIARYLERLLMGRYEEDKKPSNITYDFLVEHGFAEQK